jgi:hypothetical protein
MIATMVLLAAGVTAEPAGLDPSRTAWRYRRSVSVEAPEGFAALDLPPELRARARPDLRDVRLLAADGSEVPYVIDRVADREATRTWQGTLADIVQEPSGPADEAAGTSVWTVDLGVVRQVDTIDLDVREQDFAKHVRVEGSTDRSAWQVLADDVPIFDRAWQGRVRHTRIALGASASARYLRIGTRDHRRSPPITLVGVRASWTRRAAGETWSRPAPTSFVSRRVGVTRLRLALPPGLPIEEVSIDADDPAFVRNLVLIEVRGGSERVLADGWVYRVKLPEEALAGQRLAVALSAPPEGDEFLLDVHDADSPALRGLRVTVSGVNQRLLFAAAASPVALYYGNDVTRAPLYDLGPLQGPIVASAPLASARLGDEAPNPAYQKPAPLALGLLRGAAADVSRWRVERPLQIANGEDLYVATLAPEDLGRLRADLGDVRLVDDDGRQVPYILEPSAMEAALPLVVERIRTSERVSRSACGRRPAGAVRPADRRHRAPVRRDVLRPAAARADRQQRAAAAGPVERPSRAAALFGGARADPLVVGPGARARAGARDRERRQRAAGARERGSARARAPGDLPGQRRSVSAAARQPGRRAAAVRPREPAPRGARVLGGRGDPGTVARQPGVPALRGEHPDGRAADPAAVGNAPGDGGRAGLAHPARPASAASLTYAACSRGGGASRLSFVSDSASMRPASTT